MHFHSFLRRATLYGLTLLLSLSPLQSVAAPAVLAVLSLDSAAETTPAPATANPTAQALTPATITSRRVALQKEISVARADFDLIPEGKQEDTALWLTQEIGLLSRIDSIFAEQLHTLQHASDLAKEAATVAERTKNPRPSELNLPPPHGLTLLEQLYSERDYLIRAKELLKTDVENAAAALDDARDELNAKDRLRRSANDANKSASKSGGTQAPFRLAALESRLARESVILREKALETLKFQQKLLEPKLALLLPDFAWLQSNLTLSDADRDAAQARQDKRIAALDTALSAAAVEAERVGRLVVATERRHAGAADNTAAAAELESRRADRQTVNLMLSALATQRERQTVFADVLQLRRRTLTESATTAEMDAWAGTNHDALARIAKDRRPRVAELRKSRQELLDLQTRLADPAAPAGREAWVADRIRHLAAWVEVNERELADLSDMSTARNRLAEELGDHANPFSWSDTFAAAQTRVLATWDYEVFSVADQPIRVKTILLVITLIFAGHWISRRVSDLVGRTVFKRLGMNVGRRAAWQTLSFYGLFLIVLLVSINLFHLSLTQFSVISGALAVGIGFGSQNLISNFISGIILLLERPVNQGDVIEINGQQMTIERLGPRSTIARSFDNTHIIVPNSRLLEENVINWTLSDDVVRTRIKVGVAYGSPTREVGRLVNEVMLGLEDVNRTPEPLVIFTDFGDSALQFEASFWSGLVGRKEVESELRHRIAEAFAKAGIVMAFPQRDVHLETSKPLRIELVPPTPPAQ